MDPDEDDLKPTFAERLADGCAWLRLPVMILFMIVLYIAVWIVGLVAVVQFTIRLVSGASEPKVRKLGHCLSLYLSEIVAFMTYRSDEKPYPWGEWPCGDEGGGVPEPSEPVSLPKPEPEAPAKKPAARKRRKPAARKKPALAKEPAATEAEPSPTAGPDVPPSPE